MNAYLFVYDADCGTEEEVLAEIDQIPQIVNWQTMLPSSVTLISNDNLRLLTKRLSRRFNGGRFLVNELTNRLTDGLLTTEEWNFINNPEIAE